MSLQSWKGMCLDKDIKVPGNKIYSPDFCVFVPNDLNTLLIDSGAARGEWPIGVFFHKREQKFRAQCNVGGKRIYLGSFNTPEEASNTYNKYKSNLVRSYIKDYPHLERGLVAHAEMTERGEKK